MFDWFSKSPFNYVRRPEQYFWSQGFGLGRVGPTMFRRSTNPPIPLSQPKFDYNEYLREKQRGVKMSIPQNAYILYCHKNDKTIEEVIPIYYSIFSGVNCFQHGIANLKEPYIYDYDDVLKFMKTNHFAKDYHHVVIAKITDIVDVQIKSRYEVES